MSDEIDIEEHDVMDDPTIRRIFPDLSVIKQEINQYYEEASSIFVENNKEENVDIPENENTFNEDINKKDVNGISDIKSFTCPSQICTVPHSKINIEDSAQNNAEQAELKYPPDNIIILGSKPNGVFKKPNFESEYKLEPKLILENISYFLHRSKRYCDKCLILFPKSNIYTLHKYNVHSQKKPKVVNEANSDINSETIKQNKISKEHLCFHCNVIFPTQRSLIEHLYDVLDPKTGKSFTSSTNLKETNEGDNVIDQNVCKNMDSRKSEYFNKSKKDNEVENQLHVTSTENKNYQKPPVKIIISKRKHESNIEDLKENYSSNKKIDRKVNPDLNKHKGNNVMEIPSKKKTDAPQKFKQSKKPIISKLYKCFVCSKYSVSYKYYSNHIIKDHKIIKVPDMEKVEFESKCHFCESRMSDHKSYNTHMFKFHKKILRKTVTRREKEVNKSLKETKKQINFALKSILYKCTKCEIFCLSANAVLRHFEHSDASNNWNCSICHKIFNNKDKELHLKQHSLCQAFTIYELNESEISRVLYKCSKCAVHYSENNFLTHYTICGLETPNSIYCKVCDMLVNRADMNLHRIIHEDKQIQYSDFTVMESDIITENCTKNVKDSKKNKKSPTTPGEYYFQNSTKYAFCRTCECCVTISCNKKIMKQHYNDQCRERHKSICKKCGIVLTSGTHKKHLLIHEKAELNLQDFIFYELKTKIQICPPVPIYPSCKICDIHFLTKRGLRDHICEEQEYQTCNICVVKLTEQAYKFHMQFHKYSIHNVNAESKFLNLKFDLDDDITQNTSDISHSEDGNIESPQKQKDFFKKNCKAETGDEVQDRSKLVINYCQTCKSFISNIQAHKARVHIDGKCGHMRNMICKECGLVFTTKSHTTHKELHKKKQLSLHQYIFYDLNSKRKICPPIPDYPSCNNCGVHFLRTKAILEHSCKEQEFMTCNICSIKLTEHAYKLHMAFHNYSIKNTKKRASNETDLVLEPNSDILNKISFDNVDVAKQVTVLYFCKSCQIILNTYDKTIEHCQDHYDNNIIVISTQQCDDCNLVFESGDFKEHNNLHSNVKFNKASVNVIDFDPLYFRFNCEFWTKHVFAYVADEQIKRILEASIYKYECRLKMVKVQSGSSNLTIYKCDKCSVCVEPHMIYMHAEKCKKSLCPSLTNYLCDVCDINFNSPGYRKIHEEEHKNIGVNLNSYRMVLFNKTEHDKYNKIMFNSFDSYILHQCRQCDRIVEKFLRKAHTCKYNNLKNCLKCGLLLHNDDYDLHFIRHEELEKFNDKNIIVVMFGKSKNELQEKELKSRFTGTIYDYTLYKCNNCELCISSNTAISTHVCIFNNSKRKCPKCSLSIPTLEINDHFNLHDSAMELDEFNLNLLTFDPPNKSNEKVIHRGFEENDNLAKQTDDVKINKNLKEKTKNRSEIFERIFKCHCGLHFLEELNAQQHANTCNIRMKISKQSCFKCDLLFTPGELFNHLLKHHCDKKIQFKFDVVMVHKKD